jgi:hypothetical protein
MTDRLLTLQACVTELLPTVIQNLKESSENLRELDEVCQSFTVDSQVMTDRHVYIDTSQKMVAFVYQSLSAMSYELLNSAQVLHDFLALQMEETHALTTHVDFVSKRVQMAAEYSGYRALGEPSDPIEVLDERKVVTYERKSSLESYNVAMDRDFEHLDFSLDSNRRKGLFFVSISKSVENLARTETIGGPKRVTTVKSSPNDKVPPSAALDVNPSTNFFNAMLNVERKSLMVDPTTVMRRASRARISTRSEIRAANKRNSTISSDSQDRAVDALLGAQLSTTSLNSRSGASGRKSSAHIPSTGNPSIEELFEPITIQVPTVVDTKCNSLNIHVLVSLSNPELPKQSFLPETVEKRESGEKKPFKTLFASTSSLDTKEKSPIEKQSITADPTPSKKLSVATEKKGKSIDLGLMWLRI